jgi:hypothetical protein
MDGIVGIRIVATNGTSNNIKVTDANTGEEITGITKIVIDPILPNDVIKATIEVYVSELDLGAESKE